VATDTCGQERPLKLRNTCCAYWIWVAVALMVRGAVTATGGLIVKVGTGCPPGPAVAGILSAGCPGSNTGTGIVYSTVSIQKVAVYL